MRCRSRCRHTGGIGCPVETKAWFRRGQFHTRVEKPKWHKLESAKKGILTYPSGHETPGFLVRAICGYEYSFARALHGPNGPLWWQDEVKTRNLRCSKCDRQLTQASRVDMIEP
jgi:hypothetical protein